MAMLDLWRIHLDQCPECGHTHVGANCNGGTGKPERHIYVHTEAVPEDLTCGLCGEAFQNPVLALCGHHYCKSCVRALLIRTAGRAACPADGSVLTRFALQPPDATLAQRLSELMVRCPVCDAPIRRADLDLHLQDPVHMVEEPGAYEAILRPFYMSCPLSKFAVGEMNGTSSIIRFYRRLGKDVLRRFVRTSDNFIVLPDPKMGFQPHTDEEIEEIRAKGGYFNAWWVHPAFQNDVWWREDGDSVPGSGSATARSAGARADKKLLDGQDCSQEPWAASSFCHTWSAVQKPRGPGVKKYLCSLRDLRGEHLPMLEAFREDVLKFLEESFGVPRDAVWIFCHFPSSARYSTLHFHIIFGQRFEKHARKLERPHQLSRQFSLESILRNLQQHPKYFAEVELRYFLGDKADLMDPLSMYYECSPHRHIGGFTFKWDDTIIPPHRRARPAGEIAGTSTTNGESPALGHEIRRRNGSATLQAHTFPSANSAGASQIAERAALQVAEMRRGLEEVQRTVAELTIRVAEHARLTDREELGAARMALAIAADAERRAAWIPVGAALLGVALGLAGGLAAGAFVAARRGLVQGPARH